MSRDHYLALKCQIDRREAERLAAGEPKPRHKFVASDITASQRADIEHRAAIAEHEATAAKPPRPTDSARPAPTHPPRPTF